VRDSGNVTQITFGKWSGEDLLLLTFSLTNFEKFYKICSHLGFLVKD